MSSASLAYYPARSTPKKIPRPRRLQQHRRRTALLGISAATPIEIWFQVEARVGHQGTHAHIWAPAGSRPLMVRDNRHDSAYLFGAIFPARGVGAAMITPHANVEAMNLHLAEIGTQVTAGAMAGLICDGATWHQRGKQLVGARQHQDHYPAWLFHPSCWFGCSCQAATAS